MDDEGVCPECEEAFSQEGYNENDPLLLAHLQAEALEEPVYSQGEDPQVLDHLQAEALEEPDYSQEEGPQVLAHPQAAALEEEALEEEALEEEEFEEEDEDEDLEGETCEYCDQPAVSNPEPDVFLCEDCDAGRDDSFFKNASEW
ncbi:hypothetical protein [Lamprobacter modestohalophilus]|nr:hypothetical protein [Lamprobacter modestohalophilus]